MWIFLFFDRNKTRVLVLTQRAFVFKVNSNKKYRQTQTNSQILVLIK